MGKKKPEQKAAPAAVAKLRPGPKKAPEALLKHSFKPGQSGNPNGRQKGSRNRLSESFILALHDQFEKNGKEAIELVALNEPATFLKLVADLVPKDFDLNIKGDSAFVAMWKMVSEGAAPKMSFTVPDTM